MPTSIHRVVLGLALLPVLLSTTDALSNATEWTRFQISDGYIYVETTVAGIRGFSRISPGFQYAYINEPFWKSAKTVLTPKRTEETRLGKKSIVREYFPSVPAVIFGQETVLGNLMSRDQAGEDTQLVLGKNFLHKFVYQIDFPRKRLRAITRDVIDLESKRNVTTDMEVGHIFPIVKVLLDGKRTFWLTFDPGSSPGIQIHRKAAKRGGWLSAKRVAASRLPQDMGSELSYTIPSVEVGGVEIIDVSARSPKLGYISIDNPRLRTYKCQFGFQCRGEKTDGILGYDVLKHLVVTIDFRTGYMIISTDV